MSETYIKQLRGLTVKLIGRELTVLSPNREVSLFIRDEILDHLYKRNYSIQNSPNRTLEDENDVGLSFNEFGDDVRTQSFVAIYGRVLPYEAVVRAIVDVSRRYPAIESVENALERRQSIATLRHLEERGDLEASFQEDRPVRRRPNSGTRYNFKEVEKFDEALADIIRECESNEYYVVHGNSALPCQRENYIFENKAAFDERRPPVAKLTYNANPHSSENMGVSPFHMKFEYLDPKEKLFLEKCVKMTMDHYEGRPNIEAAR